jgi:hypothetical protein
MTSLGQEAAPMLSCIPMDRTVPDVMHLAMRCMEKLIQIMYADLKPEGRKTPGHPQNRYLAILRNILKNKSFCFLESPKRKGWFKKPSLTGAQSDLLLENLQRLVVFRTNEQEEDKRDKVEVVTSHIKVFSALRQNKKLDEEEINALEQDIVTWTKRWTGRYINSWINSCHVVSQHLIAYLRLYGNIYKFAQQGVESSVKLVKRSTSSGIFGSVDVCSKYMKMEARRMTRLRERAAKWKLTVCPRCKKQGHSRMSHKSCDFRRAQRNIV